MLPSPPVGLRAGDRRTNKQANKRTEGYRHRHALHRGTTGQLAEYHLNYPFHSLGGDTKYSRSIYYIWRYIFEAKAN